MLSTGDAIRNKGSDTLTQYFLTDRDLSFDERVCFFAALAKNPHTTRFTINASDNRAFPEGGQQHSLRTLTNDQKIATKASFNEIYEDVDAWVEDVRDIDVYHLAGSFDFDGKWTWLEMRDDGTISALFRRDRSNVLQILTDAESTVVG